MHQVHGSAALIGLVRGGAIGWSVALLVLLGVLDGTLGLGATGWVAGTSTGLVLASTLARRRTSGVGPADHVTAARAVLAGGVTALVAEGLVGDAHTATLVALAGIALAMDLVDG